MDTRGYKSTYGNSVFTKILENQTKLKVEFSMNGQQKYPNPIQRSLSCLSPNGLTTHSLVQNDEDNKNRIGAKIVTHFLPIEKEKTYSDTHTQQYKNDHDVTNPNHLKIVETTLPDRIISLLKIDPAIELLCVDNNMASTSPIASITAGEHYHRKRLPLLALYSSSSLWLISITFTPNENLEKKVTGKISFILEPFEDSLLTCHSSTRIIRVRAAPSSLHYPRVATAPVSGSSSNKCNMICPSGSMALLTSEGALILNHARSVNTNATTSAHFHKRKNGTRYGVDFESDSDDDNIDDKPNSLISYYTTTPFFLGLGSDNTNVDPISDFCFGNSSNDIFTVYVLRKSGDVYAANPILFDGTAIPRNLLQQRLSQLDHDLETMQCQEQNSSFPNDTMSLSIVPKEPQDSKQDDHVENLEDLSKLVRSSDYKEAQVRRIKAEKQYLKDSFPDFYLDVDNKKENGYYLTSHIHGGASKNATLWPVLFQGPLLFGRTTVKINDNDAEQKETEIEFPCDPAVTIESFNFCISNNNSQREPSMSPSKEDLNYIVIGRLNGLVDICILSKCLESRFGFESLEDTTILDKRIIGAGAILETIIFNDIDEKKSNHDNKAENSESGTASIPSTSPCPREDKNCKQILSLIVDSVLTPKQDQLIHYISQTEVFTISTSIMSNFLTKKTEKSTTTAWSCLTIGADSHLTGAVVSGDPSLGHILVATISTGKGKNQFSIFSHYFPLHITVFRIKFHDSLENCECYYFRFNGGCQFICSTISSPSFNLPSFVSEHCIGRKRRII